MATFQSGAQTERIAPGHPSSLCSADHFSAQTDDEADIAEDDCAESDNKNL